MASGLNGKVVLVSGASGGLGSVVAETLTACGAQVVAVARRTPPEPGHAVWVAADLGTAAGCAAAVVKAREEFGKLDALVHLVGGFAGGAMVEETSEETWDRMMNINLRAAFLMARAALPELKKRGDGRVVMVGSRAGVDLPAGLGAYAVSKAALHALVRVLAVENRPAGVTVNALLPATIDTAANRASMPKGDASRWVAPESIAGLIAWLVSDAGADVSGALIPVYGRS